MDLLRKYPKRQIVDSTIIIVNNCFIDLFVSFLKAIIPRITIIPLKIGKIISIIRFLCFSLLFNYRTSSARIAIQ